MLDANGPRDKYYDSFTNSRNRNARPQIYPKTVVKQQQPQQPQSVVKVSVERPVIRTISDIIKMANEYPMSATIQYENVNMSAIHAILPFLNKINAMIGLESIKKDLTSQIIYYLQPFNKGDYKHTIISGPPGTGKTELAKLMGDIFSHLGVFGDNSVKFKKATRSDLIAGYLGQTAIKTSELIKSSLGGVLFIDEAYSLGGSDKKDAYSKECIDTLCESLSLHKDNLMVIVAGYENELNDCFFSYNAGLKSRFAWKYTIVGYNAEELYSIFISNITQYKPFSHNRDTMIKWFSMRMDMFASFGRDVDIFVSKIKIVYANRMFCCETQGPIIMEDIEMGYELMVPAKPKPQTYSFYS
jgi:SpoVK/Ycf46/Vps4 family AAA+-type ATPase